MPPCRIVRDFVVQIGVCTNRKSTACKYKWIAMVDNSCTCSMIIMLLSDELLLITILFSFLKDFVYEFVEIKTFNGTCISRKYTAIDDCCFNNIRKYEKMCSYSAFVNIS